MTTDDCIERKSPFDESESIPSGKPVSKFRKDELRRMGIDLPLTFVRWLANQGFWSPMETRMTGENWHTVVAYYSLEDLRNSLNQLGKQDIFELQRVWRLLKAVRSKNDRRSGAHVTGRYAIWESNDDDERVLQWVPFEGVLKNGWIVTGRGERKSATGNHIEYRRTEKTSMEHDVKDDSLQRIKGL